MERWKGKRSENIRDYTSRRGRRHGTTHHSWLCWGLQAWHRRLRMRWRLLLHTLSLGKRILIDLWHVPGALLGFCIVPILATALGSVFLPWLVREGALDHLVKTLAYCIVSGLATNKRNKSSHTSTGVINSKGLFHCVAFVCTL